MDNEGRFMVAVGAVIENGLTGKILLIKRSDVVDHAKAIWEIPYGRMKQFEEVEDALVREVKEETGLTIQPFKIISYFHFFRDEKVAAQEVVGLVFWVKVNKDLVVLSNEHTEYKWVHPENASKFVNHEGIQRDIQAYIKEKKMTSGQE